MALGASSAAQVAHAEPEPRQLRPVAHPRRPAARACRSASKFWPWSHPGESALAQSSCLELSRIPITGKPAQGIKMRKTDIATGTNYVAMRSLRRHCIKVDQLTRPWTLARQAA